jgi:hypothetical protein
VYPLLSPRIEICLSYTGVVDFIGWRYFLNKEITRNDDRVKGTAKQVKGFVKEETGQATGNKETETKGKAEKEYREKPRKNPVRPRTRFVTA